jgi:enamine deaminase RidA (YjgF/YER057c/UK114 family)
MTVEGTLLFISGQTPTEPDGSVSADPEAQLRQVWANLRAVLDVSGAQLHDLVHVRTYLADRGYRDINSQVRQEVLGDHQPALTVVICDLYEDSWVAEVEAVAVLPTC